MKLYNNRNSKVILTFTALKQISK